MNSQQFCWPLRAAAFRCISACLHKNTPLLLSPKIQSASTSHNEEKMKQKKEIWHGISQIIYSNVIHNSLTASIRQCCPTTARQQLGEQERLRPSDHSLCLELVLEIPLTALTLQATWHKAIQPAKSLPQLFPNVLSLFQCFQRFGRGFRGLTQTQTVSNGYAV